MGSRLSFDHYIYAAHMRRWATDNKVTVLRRGAVKAKLLDVGNAVATEQGLNAPAIEAAYGKVEDAFNRTLRKVLDSSIPPTSRDWRAIREYAVLMHDRYPGLRGSASDEHGSLGGNAMMVPNPANWGAASEASNPFAHLAKSMDREQLKAVRLQLLPTNARFLPAIAKVVHCGPMLLGDAGIHAVTLHPDSKIYRTYVAMPLSPAAMVVFGDDVIGDEDARNVAGTLNMKVAMESTVLVDTLEAPFVKGFVADMWSHQLEPSGPRVPRAVDVWSRIDDVPPRDR